MAKTEWKMKGKWVKNCNCATGCPCDFWERPTNGFCTGMLAMEIDEGHFGATPLTGLKFAVLYHWPGALHEGNGTVQPIVDERATPTQREAILTILSGNAGDPWFEVVASVVSTVHDPVFAPIEFEFDLEKCLARVAVPGLMETVSQPVKNLATGLDHRAQVVLPAGMEYRLAELAKAVVNKAQGKVAYDCPMSHSSLAYVTHTQDGLIN